MSPTFDAFLRSWPFDPWLLSALLLTSLIYFRGWKILRRRSSKRWTWRQPAAFVGGLTTIFLALASPIESFASLLLQVHMMQHLLLMMVGPPLLWLSNPFFPLLRGLPNAVRIYWIIPLLKLPALRRIFEQATHPLVALPLYVASTWLWHVPAIYSLAMQSDRWHYMQHMCFLGSSLLFWYPVVRPYPSRPRWSLWLLIPYLLLADLQNTVLSALLTFSDKVLYHHYNNVPRLDGLSALDDQAGAGVLMWVPGSVAFLVPLFWIGIGVLFGRRPESGGGRETGRQGDKETRRHGDTVSGGWRIALPLILASDHVSEPAISQPHQSFDVMRMPLVGWLLQGRKARLALQLSLLLVAGAVIYDGLQGPALGPMNLAGVLPWIHWRGFLMLGLLVAGNVFCMACPFTLPRTVARRWLPRQWRWPRPLRSKWLAVGLLVLFFWAYEAFSLWDSPWWTAWIAVGYFVCAFVIDSFFQGASFCKYVCPIGQFNFVQSLVSPFEVKVREPNVCVTCQTKDCIRGRDGIPGCEMHLFQPRKVGNMDCTFCLDCIHACPHGNVGILARAPGSELWTDTFRSGVGRFAKRPDIAALVLVLVFGAFVNAAGMVEPVVTGQGRIQAGLGIDSPLVMATMLYVIALLVIPSATISGVSALSSRLSKAKAGWIENATRYSFALVPLGFGMWLAHYCFHFLASFESAIPATQRFLADQGISALGPPEYVMTCCRTPGEWLTHLEIIFLDLGLLVSLYAGYRIALSQHSSIRRALATLSPWAMLLLLLFATGIWIILEPMQMRGTFMAPG